MRVLAWNLQVKMNFVIFGIIGRTSQGLVWFCSPPTSRFSGASNMAGVVCFLVVITAFTAHAANEVQNIVSWMTGDARLLQGDMRQLMSEAKRNMPEMFRDAPEAIRAHGYPLETHKVRTEDGYILTMHRIPRGRAGGRGGWRGPVYLLHGIFGASDSWVIGGPGVAPAYFMADDGYDVWLGNSRGNYYSREHVNFTAKDKEFWRFSWNEMGMYDTPAMIDYVLKETGQDKLIHVAHSMGNNIYYVMLSNKPEYVNKIRLKIDIAPSVFWDNMKAPIGKLIRDNHRLIKVIMDLQSTYELLRPSPARKAFYFFGCHKNSSQRKLCGSLFYASVGVSGVRDKNKLPIHLARMMESTSGPTMVHLAQNAKSGRFCQFDYGPQGNIKHYGTPYPPEYDLKKATAPTVLYTSTGDDLVPADGVVRLSQEIPNALELYWVPEKIFNHLDFLVHEETYDLLLHHMLKVMSKY